MYAKYHVTDPANFYQGNDLWTVPQNQATSATGQLPLEAYYVNMRMPGADKTEFYARFDRKVSLKGKSQPFNAYIVFWNPKEIELDRARPAGPAAGSRASGPAAAAG